MNKKLLLILGVLAVLAIGPAVYFLSSSERQVTETFSTFSFKNDPTTRPPVGSEEEGEYGVLGDTLALEEPEEEGWFTRWMNSRSNTVDEPEESSGGGSDAESADTESGTGYGSVAYTPSQTTQDTATSDGGTTDTTAPVTTTAVPKSYTLTITSPTTGSVLSNKTCSTSSDTTCYERPIATVFWTYGDLSAKITIELHNESGLVRTLTTKTSNSGRYTWNPSLTLQDGDYKLIVRAYSSSGTLVATAETGYFEVSRVKEESVKSLPTPEEVSPVAKKCDLSSNFKTRVTLPLSGTQVGSIEFDSWRDYDMSSAGTNFRGINAIGTSMTPAYTFPVGGRLELNVSETPGSFTPISSECQLKAIDYYGSLRQKTYMRLFTYEPTALELKVNPCLLEPNTKYYMNVRFVDENGETTCAVDRCGIYIDVRYGQIPGVVNSSGVVTGSGSGDTSPVTAGEQAACDKERDYYLSEEYSDWYYSLAPSSRAYVTAPGDSAAAQRFCEDAIEQYRINNDGGNDGCKN